MSLPSESPGSLLVVDDSEANRDMLSRRLARRGFAVDTASGGREALELIRAKAYDVVLLDLMMPEMGGLEMLGILRQSVSATELPVIIATAKDESSDVVEGLKAGANDYVTKPLDLPVVLARVQTQVSLKRAVDRVRLLERDLAQRNAALEEVNRYLTAANVRMERDLLSAARIQQSMLPASLPESEAVTFAWRFKPCAEVAGDGLNIFRLDEHHVGMYVLDVVGHGVAAALLSVSVARVLSPTPNSFLLRPREDGEGYRLLPPVEVGNQLNRRFQWDATQQFFSLLYGVLDLRTSELRYICAGHPPPVHVKHGVDALSVLGVESGTPIGVSETDYVEQSVQLAPGDRIYCYSDGVSEAMSATDEIYTTQRLLDCIGRTRSVTLTESLDTVWSEIVTWSGEAFRDDASLLALEMKAP